MKFRLVLFFVFMGAFSLVFFVGTTMEVSQEEAELFMEQLEALVDGIDGSGIFLHNTTLAIPMFIPGFGVAWGLFAAWSTGLAFSALGTIAPELRDIPALSILYLTPFGLMELISYSLGTSRSYMLIMSVIKRRSLVPQIKPTIIEIGIVVGLLLAGGYIEFYIIESMPESGFDEMFKL